MERLSRKIEPWTTEELGTLPRQDGFPDIRADVLHAPSASPLGAQSGVIYNQPLSVGGPGHELYVFRGRALKARPSHFQSRHAPFEEIKRKVEASEPPNEYRGRDDAVEDAYQEAFEDADTAIQVIGMSSLGLVQTALHEFLKEFVERSFGPAILKQVPQIKADGWLGKFRALFASNADYDWANSGADLALIEQACLTRNDFHHSVNLLTRYPHQGKTYAEKYADSPFRDPAFAGALMQEYPLRVTRELLES